MPKIQIPPGIERNNTPFDTANRWWDMSQVRWQSGSFTPDGGWNRTTSTPLDSPVRTISVWRDNSVARQVMLWSDAKVYADTGSYVDVTPPAWQGPGTVSVTGGYGTGPYGQGNYGSPGTVPSPIFSPYGYVTASNWGQDLIYCANTDGRLFYASASSIGTAAKRIGPSFSAVSDASFTASIAAAVMTVTAVASGTLGVGDKITGTGVTGDDTGALTIVNQLTGSAGSTGTYTVSQSQTLTSRSLQTFPATTTGAVTGCNAVVTTAERHVMAIGYSGNPRGVAWCSQEDPTDWNFSSTTNTAGFLTLQSKTPLLAGFTVAEGTLVLSYSDVFLIRYISQPYVYGGTEAISDTAAFNPRTVATFSGKAAWFNRRGFQLYAGGYVQPLPCPVANDILGGEDPTIAMDPVWGAFRAHGSHNARFPEITWFYPSVGNTECNRYITWNYEENTWVWGARSRSAMSPADAYQFPYMAGTDGHMYEHENGWLANGATRTDGSVFAETGALCVAPDMVSTTVVDQLRIATGFGYNAVSVSAFGSYTPEGTEYTEGPFTPRDDGWTDARLDYMAIRLRFSAAKDGPWAVGAIFADVSPGTGR